MMDTKSHTSELTHHTLRISNPKSSLPFYQEKLGMTLLTQHTQGDRTHYFLGYIDPKDEVGQQEASPLPQEPLCYLELIHDPHDTSSDIRKQPDKTEGYWKIAIAVKDIDMARKLLLANGVEIGEAFNVPDVAYLCHLVDPEGYCIELIQHDFLKNHRPAPQNAAHKLGTAPTFSLVTYRVKDPAKSLSFYGELLGMRLLSKQVVEALGFTLYFLACTEEEPPNPDIEDVANREWLWKRPYAMIELQHVWGTENKDDFAYRVEPKSGFERVSLTTHHMNALLETCQQRGHKVERHGPDPILQADTATVLDPDGYSIRLIGKG